MKTENSAVLVSHKTTADFAPPRWLFALRDNGDSMLGYSRREFDSGESSRAALFRKAGDEGPQVATLGRLTAIFDGRLYEPGKLAREPGAPPNSDNVPRLLLECYRARGESFFGKLRGTFVFVLWDAEKDELFCVRDPLGYYPCFFVQQANNLLVSTSARVLLDYPHVSRATNRLVLLDYFFDIWARRQETFYASILRVPPGHALRMRNGNSILYRHWNPLPTGDGQRFLKADELERFPELLARSVNRCLEHGPVGIYLSGGMDSVSVAALASERCLATSIEPPRALSLAFPGKEYNEETVQKSVARHLGLAQELVPLEEASGPDGLFGAISVLSRQFSFPIQNYWMPAYNYLALLGKQCGIRTILTGGGGDEWLGVSPFVAADLIRTFSLGELFYLWRSIGATVPVSKVRFGWNLLWVFGLRALIREQILRLLSPSFPRVVRSVTSARRARKKPPWLVADPQLWSAFSRRLEASDLDLRPLDGPYGYYFADGIRGLDHPIVSWEMEEHFENGRRLGLRFLHPYIDADLIEMLCAVPPTLLTVGNASKGLVREFLSRRFPKLGFEAQKKVVIHRALPQAVLGDVERHWTQGGKAKALKAFGLTDTERLDTYFVGLLKSKKHHDTFRAWQIMAVEHWLRACL